MKKKARKKGKSTKKERKGKKTKVWKEKKERKHTLKCANINSIVFVRMLLTKLTTFSELYYWQYDFSNSFFV